MGKFHAGDKVVVTFNYENNGLGPLRGQTARVLIPAEKNGGLNRIRLDLGHKWSQDCIFLADGDIVSQEVWDLQCDIEQLKKDCEALTSNNVKLATQVRDRGTLIFDLQDELRDERAKYQRAETVFNSRPVMPANTIDLEAHNRTVLGLQEKLNAEKQLKKLANQRLSDFLDRINQPLPDNHSSELVYSGKNDGTVYEVELDERGFAISCTCKGFVFRDTCKHLGEGERQYRGISDRDMFRALGTEENEFSPELLRAAASLLKAAQQ